MSPHRSRLIKNNYAQPRTHDGSDRYVRKWTQGDTYSSASIQLVYGTASWNFVSHDPAGLRKGYLIVSHDMPPRTSLHMTAVALERALAWWRKGWGAAIHRNIWSHSAIVVISSLCPPEVCAHGVPDGTINSAYYRPMNLRGALSDHAAIAWLGRTP